MIELPIDLGELGELEEADRCKGSRRDFGGKLLKFRDSLTEMDSRFRGNDVISARRVAFRLVVIPAKAGIHCLIQAF